MLGEVTINNVYKPANIFWPPDVLPDVIHPIIYAGDFNSHHKKWKYAKNKNCGIILVNWDENKSWIWLLMPNIWVLCGLPAGNETITRTYVKFIVIMKTAQPLHQKKFWINTSQANIELWFLILRRIYSGRTSTSTEINYECQNPWAR